jgi:hypothetical protein
MGKQKPDAGMIGLERAVRYAALIAQMQEIAADLRLGQQIR